MNEKEVLLEIIDEKETIFLLKIFGENSKSKSHAFRKQRLKTILNSSLPNNSFKKSPKKTPWEHLMKTVVLQGFESFTPTEMIKQFVLLSDSIPNSVRFLTLLHYHPTFFETYKEKMIENIQNKKYFLTEVASFKNNREVEKFWRKHSENLMNPENFEYLIDMLYGWITEAVDANQVKEITNTIKNCSLLEFEQLMAKYPTPNYEYILNYIIFLKVGKIKPNIRIQMYWGILKEYIEVERQFHQHLRKKAEEKHQENNQTLQKEVKALKKEMKQQEQIIKNLTKQSQKQVETTQKEKEKETQVQRARISQLEKELQQMKKENEQVKQENQKYYHLTEFYSRGVTQRYLELKWAICHASSLVYAKHLFPDMSFYTVNEQSTLFSSNPRVILIQQYGISYSDKRKILEIATQKGIPVVILNAKEERELIIELSQQLKEKGESLNDVL